MKKTLLVILATITASLYAQSQTFTLVKDIRPGVTTSAPDELTVWNNKLYFRANNGVNGNELHVTDGTSAGTIMVKDIRVGASGGSVVLMSVLNNKLNFFSNDGTNGTEPFGSDGTDAGTILIKDLNLGSLSSAGGFHATMNGFKYWDGTVNDAGGPVTELYRTDGTSGGTTLVKAIAASGLGGSSPREITTVGNLIFFYANNGTSGYEIWKSDGTELGTTITKDVNAGSLPSSPEGNEIKGFNNVAYFRKSDGTNGVELWRSDGTEAGTYMVKNINPGAGNSNPFNFTVFNNALYFIASDGVVTKLWKTDGTEAGTIPLVEAGGTYTTYGLTSMAVWDGNLYFPGVDATNGMELWKTDGTLAGTSLVKDINPGLASSDLQYLISVGDKLVFRATTAAAGAEPWSSDGTQAGTAMLQDIETGSGSSNIERFTIVGTKLFALASNSTVGREVWVADNFVLLPLRFDAFAIQKCGASQVCLSWKTSNEQGVAHFEIERSTDGRNFKKVGKEFAKNRQQNSYTATDDFSLLQDHEQLYYRIRQVDKDGKWQMSSVQQLRMNNKGVKIYPTVTSSNITLQNSIGKKLNFQLHDAGGRLLLQQQMATGANNISIAHLPSGTFFYKVFDQEQKVVSSGKLMKQ